MTIVDWLTTEKSGKIGRITKNNDYFLDHSYTECLGATVQNDPRSLKLWVKFLFKSIAGIYLHLIILEKI